MLGEEHYEQVMEWKMAGRSDRAISEDLGVSRATVQRFVSRSDIAGAIAERVNEMGQMSQRRLQASVNGAINALNRAINPATPDIPEPVRVRAAEVILRASGTERLAQSIDNQATAQMSAARATLALRLDQMNQRVIDATATPAPPELSVVDDEAEQA